MIRLAWISRHAPLASQIAASRSSATCGRSGSGTSGAMTWWSSRRSRSSNASAISDSARCGPTWNASRPRTRGAKSRRRGAGIGSSAGAG